jgi:hypothetical protein
MGQPRDGVEQEQSCSGFLGVVEKVHRPRAASPLIVSTWLVLLCVAGLAMAARASGESCPNEKFRTGPSATLPDCRAYELVTPMNLGRTQDLTFGSVGEDAAVSADGDHVALSVLVPVGPEPSVHGARAVFLRNPELGWEMHSAVEPGAGGQDLEMSLFGPDLSRVAFTSVLDLNFGEVSADRTLEAGPVGGRYTPIASIPQSDYTEFLGASSNFGDVLFTSTDHEPSLGSEPLLSGAERTAAEATDSEAPNLYDWTNGHLELLNFRTKGPPFNPCGATLGGDTTLELNNYSSVNAVSANGSKIFLTSPAPGEQAAGPGCTEPAHLYMRLEGGEPIEISAPAPEINLQSSEIKPVRYNYATPNGSSVFFNTETPLTAGESPAEKTENKLFEYDTEAPEGERLKLVAAGIPIAYGVGIDYGQGLFFSEDGSAVYVESATNGNGVREIYRIETGTGKHTFVARAGEPHGTAEPSYATPHGDFFLFTADGRSGEDGVEDEPRGAGHNEMYRYDNTDGNVICVTCGEETAPAQGAVIEPETLFFSHQNDAPALTPIAENGQMVFFQTTAQLVPQDRNSTETDYTNANGHPGLDVYEWEADGSDSCELAQGCTYLLSSGESLGPSAFLGASRSGSDVFFATPAQLVPQATPEFDNIYDARIDGGFPPPTPPLKCTSCQGVGSPAPLFNVPASVSFMGAGNPAPPVVKPTQTQELAKALKACRKKRLKRKRVACERQAKTRYGAAEPKASRSNSSTKRGSK